MATLIYYTLSIASREGLGNVYETHNFETPAGAQNFLEVAEKNGRWQLDGSYIINDTPGIGYAVDYYLRRGNQRHVARVRAADQHPGILTEREKSYETYRHPHRQRL